MRRSRILLAITMLGLVSMALTTLPAAPAVATTSSTAPGIVVEDGATQAVFSYADALRETLWVEAPMDSDSDGRNDRIRIDVIRPAETEEGLKVPSIMEASPYYNPGSNIDTPRGFPGWWDEAFVPRGYAIVQVEMQGTSRSEGCPTTGGAEDTLSIKAAVDWLNGRAPGYHLDGTPAQAYWSTGNVGMQGVSYVGTLPNAVATEGIGGLRTVVPIAAISSWYRYPRDQGIRRWQWGTRYSEWLANYVMAWSPRAQALCADKVRLLGDLAADDTADFTPFWQERDYVPKANKIKTSKTSVFMVHGYGDFNVKPQQTADLWYEVARRNMPRKIWIHRGGHSNPTSFRNTEWRRVMHAWMDHWLHDIENGIMDEPMADIQRPDGTWVTDSSWPSSSTQSVRLRLGPSAGAAGTLSLKPPAGASTEAFVDNYLQNRENGLIADPQQAQDNRLVYLSPPLANDVRISGTAKLSVRFSSTAVSAPLSALLVHYGTGPTLSMEDKTPLELVNESCSPQDEVNLTGCYEPMEATQVITPERVITRSSVDGKNNVDLRWSDALVPGRAYTIGWDLQPHDYVVPAGHRIGLVVTGNYRATNGSNTTQPDQVAVGSTTTIHVHSSVLSLPVVGGRNALGF